MSKKSRIKRRDRRGWRPTIREIWERYGIADMAESPDGHLVVLTGIGTVLYRHVGGVFDRRHYVPYGMNRRDRFGRLTRYRYRRSDT